MKRIDDEMVLAKSTKQKNSSKEKPKTDPDLIAGANFAVPVKNFSSQKIIEELVPLDLPGDFNEETYNSALEIDRLIAKGKNISEESFQKKLLSHDKLLNGSFSINLKDKFSFTWPDSLYIPSSADWKNYWFLPPPADHLFALAWKSSSGFAVSSKETGSLYSFAQIMTKQSYTYTDAVVGIIYNPVHTYGVVSVQPVIDCAGTDRWYVLINDSKIPVPPVLSPSGFTSAKSSIIIAAWEMIPGPAGWDYLNNRIYPVHDFGPNSGLGEYAPMTYQRSFKKGELAAEFVVEKFKTYLFGIVGRVSVSSSLKDERGKPLPLINDGTFRVWSDLSCRVSEIDVVEKQVYIP
jgi:hypothetical protein